jgi:hypothetical protein
MPFSFDKFMDRITEEEAQRHGKLEQGQGQLTEERINEIDPNRRRIMGREHWMNRTRGTWETR